MSGYRMPYKSRGMECQNCSTDSKIALSNHLTLSFWGWIFSNVNVTKQHVFDVLPVLLTSVSVATLSVACRTRATSRLT